jgi:quercetin dioxygenase-like cupin family protein
MAGATILRFAETPWNDPSKPSSAPAELVRKAQAAGARSKRMVEGQGGFYLSRNQMPPGHRIDPHSHSHDEVLFVLRGDCTLDDGTRVGEGDAVVVHADQAYGFTCGAQGMEFLTIRTGEARFASRG